MKKYLLLLFIFAISFGFAQSYIQNDNTNNPFFKEWKTPFQTPPFNEIKIEHYKPAFIKGMELEKAEIEAIINSSVDPTFENTIEAMEKSGKFFDKARSVFGALSSANTNDEMQKIANEMSPLFSKHNDDIYLSDKLFKRIKSVYDQRDKLKLNNEKDKLLEKTYKRFVRAGANLTAEQKDKLREINKKMSLLSLKFGENVLKETNKYKIIIEDTKDLDGLPQRVIDDGAQTAKALKQPGKWIFTTQKTSMIPFLQYSSKRELREKLYKFYYNRCNNNDEFDNKQIIAKIAKLRFERANLLGYKTYADFVLEDNMAKTPEAVNKFLMNLWVAALPKAKDEAAELQKIIDKEGGKFKLASWDWWYYAEKVKKEKYDLDENELRPYFKMENVRKGAFDVANKLYGITFTERKDIQVYSDDIKVFEAKDKDGSHLGIFYADYFPRSGKRAGAWSGGFRGYTNLDGNTTTPLVYNVGSFSKPIGDVPSLLSMDEVNTLFHELGHALNSLFYKGSYRGLSGFPRDFVELPSQIMENWAFEPEVMKTYAKHYISNEVIPENLLKKMENSKKFNQGFETLEYLAASILDMDWHTLTDAKEVDAAKFEDESMKRIKLMPEILPRYKSPYFSHITGNGYAAGYYSYIWAEVLDADAFNAFKEKSLFDKETAESFRRNILEKGSTDEAMNLYIKFRGFEPKIDALLKRRGLDN